MSVCKHIWSSLHACTCREGCKHTCPEHESRPLSVSPLKTASPSIQPSIYICVWELASGPSLTPLSARWSWIWTVSACLRTAAAVRQVTLAEQVEAAAMRSSELDSGQTRHRPVTKGGPVWRDSQAAGVCVSMFMEYAFMPARKSWARSPPPTPRVSGYGRGQRSCGFFQPLFPKLNLLFNG